MGGVGSENNFMNETITKRTIPKNYLHKSKSRFLRRQGILSEVLFWNEIKDNKFHNLDFDRQRVIGNYIVDFYCHSYLLIIEIDGSSHDTKEEYDKIRENYFRSLGLNVIKYSDLDTKNNLNGVVVDLGNQINKLKK